MLRSDTLIELAYLGSTICDCGKCVLKSLCLGVGGGSNSIGKLDISFKDMAAIRLRNENLYFRFCLEKADGIYIIIMVLF